MILQTAQADLLMLKLVCAIISYLPIDKVGFMWYNKVNEMKATMKGANGMTAIMMSMCIMCRTKPDSHAVSC